MDWNNQRVDKDWDYQEERDRGEWEKLRNVDQRSINCHKALEEAVPFEHVSLEHLDQKHSQQQMKKKKLWAGWMRRYVSH